VSRKQPSVDGGLKDGSRFNRHGAGRCVDAVCHSKFKKDKLGIDDLVSFGAFFGEMSRLSSAAVPPA